MTLPNPDPTLTSSSGTADIGGDPVANLASGVSTALDAAPELSTDPTLAATTAMAVQQGADPAGTAQTLTGTQQQTNLVQVAKHAHDTGWLGNLIGWVGHTAKTINDFVKQDVEQPVWDHIPGHAVADQVTNSVASFVASPLKAMTDISNKEMGAVQHEYRMWRDVTDRHGVLAGLSVLGVTALGGAVGGVLGGSAGAAIGAEGGGYLYDRWGPFQDSWDATANGEQYQLHGHQVSLGRDVAGVIGLKPTDNDNWVRNVPIVSLFLSALPGKQNLYKLISGAIDASADVASDPTLAAAGLAGVNRARTVWNSADDAEKTLSAVDRLDASGGKMIIGGVATAGPDFTTSINRAYRAFKDIAASDTGTIIQHYPTLRGIADQLGPASTVPEVTQVFRDNLAATDLLHGSRSLPSYSIARVPFRKAADALRNVTPGTVPDDASLATKAVQVPLNRIKDLTETVVRGLSNRTPFSVDPDTGKILTSGWNDDDPMLPTILYKTLRVTNSDATAKAVAARFASETDPAARHDLWETAHLQLVANIAAREGVDDPNKVAQLLSEYKDRFGMGGEGNGRIFAYGPDGQPVDRLPVADDPDTSAASPLFTPQAGKYYTPDWSEVTSMARRLSDSRTRNVYGRVDDGLYQHMTSNFFKPWALLTGGWAVRSGLNEMLTRVIGSEGYGFVKSAVEAAAEKADYTLLKANPALPDEADHVVAALGASMTPQEMLDHPESISFGARLLLAHDGHMALPGLEAGHDAMNYGGDKLGDTAANMKRLLAAVHGRTLPGSRLTRNFVDYTSADGDQFGHALSGALSEVARDPGMVQAAKAYRQGLTMPADLSVTGRRAIDSAEHGAPHLPALTEDTTDPTGRVFRTSKVDTSDATYQARQATEDWLRNTPEGQRAVAQFKSGRVSSTFGVDPITDWAARRVEGMKGLIVGQDGTVNRDLLDGIADHDMPVAGRTAGSLHPNLHPDTINSMPLESLPDKVKGRQSVPTEQIGLQQRIQNKGFSVLAPVINTLSRNGMFRRYAEQEYNFAKTLPISDEDAFALAQTRAANRMIPDIHNPYDRSQFALAARNFMPFYFAKEQAYRRMAKAITENPFGTERIRLVGHGMHEVGWTQKDPTTGQETFNYPMLGGAAPVTSAALHMLGLNVALGVPAGYMGALDGLAAGGDSPDETPNLGMSPIATIGMRGIANLAGLVGGSTLPKEAETSLEGSVSSGQGIGQIITNLLTPNAAARNIVYAAANALNPHLETRAMANAVMDEVAYAINHGDIPPAPSGDGGAPDLAFQHWMAKFRNDVRIRMIIKGGLGLVGPASPQLRDAPSPLPEELRKLTKQYGVDQGTRMFLTQNPNATASTVAHTVSDGVPPTQQALQWAAQNKGFLDKYGPVGALFAPPAPAQISSDPSSLKAYNEEIALGLRQQRTPEEFTREVFKQAAWNEYETNKTQRDQMIAANPGTASQVRSAFHNWVTQQFGPANPLWYADYLQLDAVDAQKRQMIEQARQAVTSGATPAGSEKAVGIFTDLLHSYDQYRQLLAGSGASRPLTGPKQNALHQQWNDYVDSYIQSNPEAAVIGRRLFKGA